MKPGNSKRPRFGLNAPAYKELHRAILERDGWRCQSCGTAKDLEVHHIQSRSLLGDDSEQNLITLCAQCHHQLISAQNDWFEGGQAVARDFSSVL